MGLTTTLKDKKSGKILSYITQQYITGLYVAVYTDGVSIPAQVCSDLPEREFHEVLRKAIPKKGDTFIKEKSDPLNRTEVLEARYKFAFDYCNSKKWPLSKDPKSPFRTLSKRRLNILKTRSEEACKDQYVW